MPSPHDSPRRRRAGATSAVRARLLLVLRYVAAAVPLWWLWRTVDLRAVLRHLVAADPRLLGVAGFCFLATIGVAALRWSVLMRAFGVERPPPWYDLYRHFLVGFFFNALPTGLAGDAVRGYRVQEACGGLAASYTVLFAERTLGLLALMAIAGGSLLVGAAGTQHQLVGRALIYGLGLAAGCVAGLLWGPPLLRGLVRRVGDRARWSRLRRVVERIPTPSSVRAVLVGFVLSLVTQSGAIVLILSLVLAMDPAAAVLRVVPAIPPIMMLTFIQVTPGAIGQREYVYVTLLRTAGVAAAHAVAASVAYFGLNLLVTGLGALVYLAERRPRSGEPPANRAVEDP